MLARVLYRQFKKTPIYLYVKIFCIQWDVIFIWDYHMDWLSHLHHSGI